MSLFRVAVPAPEFKFEVTKNHAQIDDNVVHKPLLSPPLAPAKKVEEKVDLIQMLIQASPRKGGQEQQHQQEKKKLESLMQTPIPAPVKFSPQSLPKSCGEEIKQMDNAKNTQLKFLLKLSA